MVTLTEEDCIQLGFEKHVPFSVLNRLIFSLGNDRTLLISNLGTPNEMLWIAEVVDQIFITDIVCLHNYDYQGFLNKEKLTALINILKVP